MALFGDDENELNRNNNGMDDGNGDVGGNGGNGGDTNTGGDTGDDEQETM